MQQIIIAHMILMLSRAFLMVNSNVFTPMSCRVSPSIPPTTAAEIECNICTIMEHFHTICSTPPFKHLPAHVMLNAFLPKGGTSQQSSPKTILTGTMLDKLKHCCLQFGAYTKTHEDTKTTIASLLLFYKSPSNSLISIVAVLSSANSGLLIQC